MAKRDPLETYNAKRDFTKTAEPAGKLAKGSQANSFVVQKHDATRMHWDFRLELDGVLKSWAVTRGPSLDPEDKRLAVRTEDHPLDYGDFEGTIAQGEYGGGTVMIWDRGTWAPIEGKSAKDLDKGHLHFVLHGERMKGEWLLIRLKPRAKEKNENWLLRKLDDAYAGSSDELTERELTSVKTGRTMQEIAEGTRVKKKPAKRRRAAPPAFQPVQLATLESEVPPGDDWLHETKYDGYRALIAVGTGEARLYTRSGLDWSAKFPELIAAAKEINAGSALLDGEIVVLDAEGRPSFSALQASIERGGQEMLFFAFDLLELDGADLKPLPNLERKERLRPLAPAIGPIRYAEHILGSGEKLLSVMCEAGLEGIVSKRVNAPYRGRRTDSWIKVKCIQRQEFVIIGWTDSTARMRGFGALIMGVRRGDRFVYAGKVGTGYNEKQIADLRRKLDPLAIEKPAAEVPGSARRGAHWVKPELVAEVAYGEMTPSGILRHARFVGLRGDKPAAAVVAERPAAPARTGVKISHREREIFPDDGVTKGDLADYYEAMAGPILATVSGRPLSLIRCPEGIGGECFFQKHGAAKIGKAVHSAKIAGKDSKQGEAMYVEDATGLVECVQMGTIEFHGWASLIADIERPDRLVFDLDPDAGIDFDEVKKAANELKEHLSAMGLVSFPMLSGGKGIHVTVPLTPRAKWPEFTGFSQRFALAMATAHPDRYVATMSKTKRKGRIFIDWMRNQRGSTAIMPWSVRARPGAPVAAPVAWSELAGITSANQYGIKDRAELTERSAGKLLAGWGIASQVLPDL